jgi:hypothetical protein
LYVEKLDIHRTLWYDYIGILSAKKQFRKKGRCVMIRRFFAVLLTVTMLASLFSGVVLAADNTNGVVLDSDGYYRYYVDGEIQTKWQTTSEGYKYYFSTSSSKYGAAVTGKGVRVCEKEIVAIWHQYGYRCAHFPLGDAYGRII